MRHLTFIFLVFALMASCSSEKEEVIKNERYSVSFSYIINVNDSKGNNILSLDKSSGFYNESNIEIINVASMTKANYEIIKSEEGIPQLKVMISGDYENGTYSSKEIIEWENLLHTYSADTYISNYRDTIISEFTVENNTVKCNKLLLNENTKWEKTNDLDNVPVFSIVKSVQRTDIFYANPITLKHSSKVSSDNAFALDLFKAVYENTDEKNIFISPLSVNSALNMLLNGAAGTTKDELIKTLRAEGYALEDINEHSRELYEAMTKVDPLSTFTSANSIWADLSLPVKESFITTNKTFYDAEVRNLGFSLPTAVDNVNLWCAEKTNNRIVKIVDELAPAVKMLLINALYFKSSWANCFERADTKKSEFTDEDGRVEIVDMMYQKNSYGYKKDDNASYLKLPFGNKAFNMTIILPDEDKTVQDVIGNIDASWTLSTGFNYPDVILHLPKFKVECSYDMDEKILPAMGMNLSFSSLADFSLISNSDLMVDKVVHKTFIEVDEDGAEAAAITAIVMDTAIADGGGGDIVDFNVNRPFLFAICENSTGAILFMGKIGKIEE